MEALKQEVRIECPDSGCMITLPVGTEMGEIIVSPETGAELEVISLNPPRLDYAPQEEEDWGE